MRHRLTTKKLNRPKANREALKKALANSFILHERITTTEARAKYIKPFVEKLVTASKTSSLAQRRRLISLLGNERNANKLLTKVGPRFAKRNGGYTRIIKLGQRQGDGAAIVSLEFVE
ncbi:MAG: 50S ribosomal protein L17 [Candidatus Nomurabacteria bacterium]|nr:MAG: 50S ribosomal protein L17 [Candidatus Nomurabacteria bacterium]